MHRKTLIWILLLGGFVSGCSYTTLLYNNAPWFVREKVDDYFSITNSQERQLDRDIESIFKWHRYEELPEYAAFIADFNRQFADGLTRDELVTFIDQIVAARTRLTEVSLESASQFLAGLSEKQLVYFDREFQLKLEKDREKASLPIEERNQKRFERLLDNLEGWFGDFNETQMLTLRELSEMRSPNRVNWLDRRQQRHQQLLAFLQDDQDAATIKNYLQTRYLQSFDQGDNESGEDSDRFWLTAMLRIDKIITPKQRQRAIKRLDGYRQDFIYLSKLGPAELNIEIER